MVNNFQLRPFNRGHTFAVKQGHSGEAVETGIDILIIESDQGDALALVGELRRQQLNVGTVTTQSVPETLSTITSCPAGLVLAASPQPDPEFFELLEQLREFHPTLPVVVVTTRCDPGQLVELLESGATSHLHRQHLEELAAVIRFVLENPSSEVPPLELEIIRETPPARSSRHARSASAAPPLQRICEHCSRIAETSGGWEPLNVFLRRNQKATVALGLCPDCAHLRRERRSQPSAALS